MLRAALQAITFAIIPEMNAGDAGALRTQNGRGTEWVPRPFTVV